MFSKSLNNKDKSTTFTIPIVFLKVTHYELLEINLYLTLLTCKICRIKILLMSFKNKKRMIIVRKIKSMMCKDKFQNMDMVQTVTENTLENTVNQVQFIDILMNKLYIKIISINKNCKKHGVLGFWGFGGVIKVYNPINRGPVVRLKRRIIG